jgi:hypothetical protein
MWSFQPFSPIPTLVFPLLACDLQGMSFSVKGMGKITFYEAAPEQRLLILFCDGVKKDCAFSCGAPMNGK